MPFPHVRLLELVGRMPGAAAHTRSSMCLGRGFRTRGRPIRRCTGETQTSGRADVMRR